eukprot:gene7218-8382_t
MNSRITVTEDGQPMMVGSTTVARLASADVGGTVIVWNVHEASVLHCLTEKNSVVNDMAWHPDDPNLFLTLSNSHLSLWNLTTATKVWRQEITEQWQCHSFQFDPFNSSRILVAANNGCIYTLTMPSDEDTHLHVDFKYRIQSKVIANTLSPTSPLSFSANSTSNMSTSSSNTGHSQHHHHHQQSKGDIVQMLFSPISKSIVYYIFAREILVFDTTTNQSFGNLSLDRTKSNFSHVILCRENPYLMFSLHEDGSITSWNRKIDHLNSHNYEQLCVSDLSHFHKKSKKKGLQIVAITNHPFYEQTLLTIAGDGIIWKWDFTSEMLEAGSSLHTPRLEPLFVRPLNGVVKLGVSGLSENISSPISSMSPYPFFNKSNVSLLAVGTLHGTIQIVNLSTLRIQKEIFVWSRPVYGLKWLSPGRVICYSFEEQDKNTFQNYLATIDFRSGRVKEFRNVTNAEPSFIKGIRLSPSRRFLVILMKDRPFELWETKKFTCLRSFKPYHSVVGLEWAPPREDSEVALSSDAARYEAREQFYFVNSESSPKCCTIEANSVSLADIPHADFGGGLITAFTCKRDLLVAGDSAGTLHVWSIDRAKRIHSISTHKGAIRKIRFAPSPTTFEILVLFASGDFCIWDLQIGQRLATATYLVEREIKAIDVEWLSDATPIVVSSDHAIRMLDPTLCLTNSRINPQPLHDLGPLFSPLILAPVPLIQLKNLLHTYRIPPQTLSARELNQSSSDIDHSSKLLSLVDSRFLSMLSTVPIAEGCLSLAQYFGDYRYIKFWRLAMQGFNARGATQSSHPLYNSELIAHYEALPSMPSIPKIDAPIPAVPVAAPTPAASSSSVSQLTSSSFTAFASPPSAAPQPASPTIPIANTPTPPLTKKQSIASFFGGFANLAQKSSLTSSAMVSSSPPAKTQPASSPLSTISPSTPLTPLSAITPPVGLPSIIATTPTSTTPTQVIANPLAASFSSVASQLHLSTNASPSQSLHGSTTPIRDSSTSTDHQSRTLPLYYDILVDAPALRNSEIERIDMQERKKPDAELTRKLIEKNILLGRGTRAINLLLDTTPDHPEFYPRAMKASVVAASISRDYYESTVRLIADNLVAVGKLDEGIQFLCMIDKSLDACKYLQSHGRWNDAAQLAKTNLPEDECMVVHRAWAIHLISLNKTDTAIHVLLSIGDYYGVVQMLYDQHQYDVASQLVDACIENHIFEINLDPTSTDNNDDIFTPISNITHDFSLKQLVQIIYKEYGNNLHQLGNIQAAEYYWIKSGKKKYIMLKSDKARVLISRGLLSKTVIISFKGTDNIEDMVTDVSAVQVRCPFSSDTVDCGRIHIGFRDAYASVREEVIKYLKGLDDLYDVYYTGHSLGGSVASVALLDLLTRPEGDRILVKSVSAVTFGQPGIGDRAYQRYMKSQETRFTYRRYVNYKSKIEEDPITFIMPLFFHPSEKILLHCGNNCPLVPAALHMLGLYQSLTFNSDYATCRTGCYFDVTRANIMKSVNHFCKATKNEMLIVDTDTTVDKYSVCLFESEKDFKSYSYSSSSSCKGGVDLINKSRKDRHVEYVLNGGDNYLVVENHNLVTPTVALNYKANFTFSTEAPSAPSNLALNPDNKLFSWKAEWDAPVTQGNTPTKDITYTLHISEFGKNWKQYKTSAPVTQKKCSLVVHNLSPATYAAVVTATNNIESHPSNIIHFEQDSAIIE